MNLFRTRLGLNPVTWDQNLAEDALKTAQRIASQGGKLTFKESEKRGNGQNLHVGPMGSGNYEQAERAWEGERAAYCAGYKQQSDVHSEPFFHNTGHYTQVAWRSTTSVGCANASVGNGMEVVVCNYSPPGNAGTQYGDKVPPC